MPAYACFIGSFIATYAFDLNILKEELRVQLRKTEQHRSEHETAQASFGNFVQFPGEC